MDLIEEVNQLQEVGFLPPELDSSEIRDDLHTDRCWADAFWRRRGRHARRTDPELVMLDRMIGEEQVEQDTLVLEIGSAYGRVTHPLAAMLTAKKVVGIDLADFTGYTSDYATGPNNQVDMSDRIEWIVGDVLTSKSLEHGTFDLVVMPMNTLASFRVDQLPALFRRVDQLMASGGRFVFSTYPESDDLRGSMEHSELLVDRDDRSTVPLAEENFILPDELQPWGIESVTFSKYTYLGEPYPDGTRYFRTTRAVMRHDQLQKVIESEGLVLQHNELIDHSHVMVVGKE